MVVTSAVYQPLSIDGVKGSQLTLADITTKRTQQRIPVSYETGPKDGPGHDLRDYISLTI